MTGGGLDAGRARSGLRHVGGRLVDAVVAQSAHARVETLRRSTTGHVGWRFQQAVPTVLWFRSGVRKVRLDVDGRSCEASMAASNGLCFFPAGVRIEGEFAADATVDYTVAFLDAGIAARYGARMPDRALVGISHGQLERGLYELGLSTRRPDAACELLVEGWCLQSLAHLSRLAAEQDRVPAPAAPGLSAGLLVGVEAYVREHMSEKLTVDRLAAVAGFSRRHFLRAFKQRTGRTPMRHVYALRLEEAKRLLATADASVSDIATACGFSHVQHLATAFHRATGMTPSQFRGGRRLPRASGSGTVPTNTGRGGRVRRSGAPGDTPVDA